MPRSSASKATATGSRTATWAASQPATILEKPMTDDLTVPVPPHSGNDTWDLIENALRELAGRRGGWLGDPLTAITMLASLIDQAGRMIPELAADARRKRASWADIATALGTSPEQAELQYSPRSPVRDTREPSDPD